MPNELVAFCFNLYEEENSTWSVELIGSSEFDETDSDWACSEVFDSREYPCRWQEEAEWEDIHNKIETYIRQYLVTGRYADIFKEYQAVAMGFVDGDLTIVYKSEVKVAGMKCPVCGKEMRSGIVKTQAFGSLLNDAMVTCPIILFIIVGTFKPPVFINRYLCLNCGFSEEWIDLIDEDIENLKKKYQEQVS